MILIVGSTGQLGGMVARRFLEQGWQVRILVRPQSNYQSLVEAGAQPVLGDLKDRASLDAACQGVDVVITTANSAQRGGDDNPQTVEIEGNRNLIDAAKAAGVGQFIFVSVNVADPNYPDPFLAGKGIAEKYLQSSGIPYTIIAPNAFMESWIAMVVGMPVLSGQPVTLVGSGERKHSFISINDVAAFTLSAINNPKAINRRLLLGGPEPLSFRGAVKVYERVLDQPIDVRSVAPGEPISGMPEHVVGLVAGFDMFDSPIPMEAIAREFAVDLTPLEKAVRVMLTAAQGKSSTYAPP